MPVWQDAEGTEEVDGDDFSGVGRASARCAQRPANLDVAVCALRMCDFAVFEGGIRIPPSNRRAAIRAAKINPRSYHQGSKIR